ncbi:hypothetical protein D0B54_08260 [Solimonas sp. K1W22B-7]|uniref:hypothetical protein n=1 Tax=Solimonas sp. K1W22B-7 TaxID=2303331 RepID=UPI000E32FFCE|nr:hypothetical protein [Solimonas sp. K1W22B-7]AXQ28672.1 hypothetical protein D0B54_08260 [Solimonas sp. K1W22B-7]
MNPKSILAAALMVAIAGLSACDDDDDVGSADGDIDTGPFAFQTAAPGQYFRVDRMGEPATATVLISSATPAPTAPGNPANPNGTLRDAFNRADPAGDAADFGAGFVARLKLISFELGPNLRSFGLTTCSVQGATPDATNIDVCLAQAAGVVLPDVISLNPNNALPDSWPNGRYFDDPVVDRLVAAALLNISVPVPPATAPPHTINTLAGLPLNPAALVTADGSVLPAPARVTTFPFLRAKNL